MKPFLFLLFCALGVFSIGCERHPLAHDPHPADKHVAQAHAGHGAADPHAPAASGHTETHATTPAASHGAPGTHDAKPGEAPKFFPGKK